MNGSTAPSGMTQDQLLQQLQRMGTGPASGPPGQPPQGGPPNMSMATGLPNMPPPQSGAQQPPPGFFQSPGGQNVPQVGRVQPQWAGTPQIQGGRMGTGSGGGTKVTASGALGLLMGLGFGVHDLLNQKKTTASRSLADQYMDIASTRGPDAAKQWVAEDNKRVKWLNTINDPKKAGSPEYQGVQQAYQTRLSGEQQQQATQAAQQKQQADILRTLGEAKYYADRPEEAAAKLAQDKWKVQYQAAQRNVQIMTQVVARHQDVQARNQTALTVSQRMIDLGDRRIKAAGEQKGLDRASRERIARQTTATTQINDQLKTAQSNYSDKLKAVQESAKQYDELMKEQDTLMHIQTSRGLASRAFDDDEEMVQKQTDLTNRIQQIKAQQDFAAAEAQGAATQMQYWSQQMQQQTQSGLALPASPSEGPAGGLPGTPAPVASPATDQPGAPQSGVPAVPPKPSAGTPAPMRGVQKSTGKPVVSYDGGKTWQMAQ